MVHVILVLWQKMNPCRFFAFVKSWDASKKKEVTVNITFFFVFFEAKSHNLKPSLGLVLH